MINVVILKGEAWSMFSELYQEALILRKYFRVFWTKSIIFYLLSFILQINLLNLGRLERIWPVSGVVCLQKLMNEEKEANCMNSWACVSGMWHGWWHCSVGGWEWFSFNMLVLRTFSEVVRWDACCLFRHGVRWGDLVGMIGKRLSLNLEKE